MDKYFFDYWNKISNDKIEDNNFKGFYLGNEACPEFFKKNLDNFLKKAQELKEINKKIVLVIPPLFENYFYLLNEIDFSLFDEITVNDFGTLNFLLGNKEKNKLEIKINIGRLLVKLKTGFITEEELKELNNFVREEIKEILVNKKIMNFLKDKINLMELNPAVQGLNLKRGFEYSIYWPYVLNATTLMCWSNIDNRVIRVNNCNTLCKKFEGDFLGKNYFLIGNQTLFKNYLPFEEYLKRIKNNDLIKRIIILNY
ncbi:MAG: hypothetical protein ABGW69_01665 [Nanoarchaeota archaeon]